LISFLDYLSRVSVDWFSTYLSLPSWAACLSFSINLHEHSQSIAFIFIIIGNNYKPNPLIWIPGCMGVACLSTCNISFERRDCSSTPTFSIPKPLGPLRADNLCSATSLGQLGYSASTKFCRPLHKKKTLRTEA